MMKSRFNIRNYSSNGDPNASKKFSNRTITATAAPEVGLKQHKIFSIMGYTSNATMICIRLILSYDYSMGKLIISDFQYKLILTYI